MLGVDDEVIEGADLDGKDLVVSVRLRRRQRNRCGRCGQRCAGYILPPLHIRVFG